MAGLGEILEELKRLREDFEKWIKMEKERWEAVLRRERNVELDGVDLILPAGFG